MIVRRFAERGESGKKKQDPRSDRVRNPTSLAGLKRSSTYKSYKLSIKHLLTQVHKIARVNRSKRLIRNGSPATGVLK